MRTIRTAVTVYTFDELSESAQEHAVLCVQETLFRAWDSGDMEQLEDTLLYGLAEALKSPGWDTYGAGDFPGIEGVKIKEWDLDRGEAFDVAGVLNRENAPALPWQEGIALVHLGDRDFARKIHVETDDDNATGVEGMREAVETALRAGWQAGRDELTYMESAEYAKDWIEGNKPEFTDKGHLYQG